jgi:hypothetical protein
VKAIARKKWRAALSMIAVSCLMMIVLYWKSRRGNVNYGGTAPSQLFQKIEKSANKNAGLAKSRAPLDDQLVESSQRRRFVDPLTQDLEITTAFAESCDLTDSERLSLQNLIRKTWSVMSDAMRSRTVKDLRDIARYRPWKRA